MVSIFLNTQLENGTLDVQKDDERKNSFCLRTGHDSIPETSEKDEDNDDHDLNYSRHWKL
jgi:hypothetical protein